MITPLNSLIELQKTNNIQISVTNETFDTFKRVQISVQDKSWKVLVHDEYGDLNNANQLMSLFLVLRELEVYQEASDFLRWCNQASANASNPELLQYYKELGNMIYEIEHLIGSIDSQITSLDYELRTSVIQELIQAG